MSLADAVPLLVGAGAALLGLVLRMWALRRSRGERERVVQHDLLERLVPMPPRSLSALRSGLFAAGLGVVAAVWAGAGWRGEAGRGAASVEETVLALDASNSMLARDVEPSRLDVQRALATELVRRLDGSIGVVYFSGRGYVLSPLTPDRGAVLMQIDAVAPSRVGRGGSSTVEGILQAVDLLAGGDPSVRRRAVVIFTDGEDTVEGTLDAALDHAVQRGVRVHAVGIGTPEGGRIPLEGGQALIASPVDRAPGGAATDPSEGVWLRDSDGDVVITRLDEESLRIAAERTGGLYVPGTPEGVERLTEELTGGGSREERRSTASLLLLVAFGLLWSETFLFRSG